MTPTAVLSLRNLAKACSFGGRFMLPLRILRRVFYGTPGTVEIGDFDGDLTIQLRLSEHMQSRIFWMGYYSREVISTLNSLLRPGMTLIDIGANIGEVSMVSAKRVGKSGKVLAFEPLSSHADRLETNLRTNGIDWVRVIRLALSDHEGTTEIYESCGQGSESDEHFGLNSLYRAREDVAAIESIGVTTLDAFLDRSPLDRIDVIKIDIEGSELPCLAGARTTIARHLPYIVIEVQSQSSRAAGYEQGDILRELEVHGYQFELIGHNGNPRRIDVTTLKAYQNILCTPPRRENASGTAI